MKEKIVRFGASESLIGVISSPDLPRGDQSNKPAIIIINAGSVHKVGPFRLHVEMARWLASNGYLCLRFDLSGQGESQKQINESYSRADQVLIDMQSALDYLQNTYEQSAVISIGLCTGADNAHRIAVNDDRIVGVVWIDGYGYRTLKYSINKFVGRLSKPVSFCKAIVNRLNKNTVIDRGDVEGFAVDGDQYYWELPPIDIYRRDMAQLSKRAVRCLYIYSGGVQSYYNYQGQMKDAFKGEEFVSSFREIYFPKADHTFFIRKDRKWMFDQLAGWLADGAQLKS